MTDAAKRLLEKWRGDAERWSTNHECNNRVVAMDVAAANARRCADELAAALPAIEQEVRKEALEEAAQLIERTHTLDYLLVIRNQLQMEIRALAPSEPERKEQGK